MTKEYHVFTHQQDTHEQAFVFSVDRLEDGGLELDELWMITIQTTGEVRSRMQFGNMLDVINNNVGGNIDDVETIAELFKDILPKEKLDEISLCQTDKEQMNLDVEKLLDCDEVLGFIDKAENIDPK
jgi:hypothetical protein